MPMSGQRRHWTWPISTSCARLAAATSSSKGRRNIIAIAASRVGRKWPGRNRGLPARLVNGLTLARGEEQSAHTWVEAWVRSQWLPMCPFHHHFGRVPRTYLVFSFGGHPLVRGRNTSNFDQAFLVERVLSA